MSERNSGSFQSIWSCVVALQVPDLLSYLGISANAFRHTEQNTPSNRISQLEFINCFGPWSPLALAVYTDSSALVSENNLRDVGWLWADTSDTQQKTFNSSTRLNKTATQIKKLQMASEQGRYWLTESISLEQRFDSYPDEED